MNAWTGTTYDTLPFDGATTYLAVSASLPGWGGSPSAYFGGALSVALYLNAGSFAAAAPLFVAQLASGLPVFALYLSDASGGLGVVWSTAAAGITPPCTFASLLVPGRTQRLVATLTASGVLSVYVDGQPAVAGSCAGPAAVQAVTAPFTIFVGGGVTTGAGAPQFFNGSMADLQIYSYALSASIVYQLHKGEIGNCPASGLQRRLPRPPKPNLPL